MNDKDNIKAKVPPKGMYRVITSDRGKLTAVVAHSRDDKYSLGLPVCIANLPYDETLWVTGTREEIIKIAEFVMDHELDEDIPCKAAKIIHDWFTQYEGEKDE